MDAEQAWQSVLGQLQMEMPRASFDNWVRDTRVLSYEDGVLAVSVRTDYARDWLENRLLSTVSRLLAGMLNCAVEVRFVVADEPDNEPEEDEQDTEEDELPANEVQVEAVWGSSYEQIVRPDKAIVINGYFLRHLRILGPDLGWLYIGFRQAAYSAGGRSGLKTARFTGKSIATLSGTPERTFWNRAGNPKTWERLQGLVDLIDEKPQWDNKKVGRGSSKFPKRLPRKFSVSMTLPLTATDTGSLIRWISDHKEACGGPAGVLASACEAPITELIPISATETEGRQAQTVRQILYGLFGNDLQNTELDAFAERLHMHLMPSGDLLVIALFFVEHVLPRIGEGQGWMLSILRDRCWVDTESGETRNQVTVKGGYTEIAGWLGLSRAKTIWEWLRYPVLQMYLREERDADKLEIAEGNKWNCPRFFEVLLDEVPAEIVQLAISNTDLPAHFLELSKQDFNLGVGRFKGSGGAFGSMGVARFTQDSDGTSPASGGASGSIVVADLAVPGGAIGSMTVADLAVSGGAIGSMTVARLAVFSGAIGRVFKLLNSSTQLLNSKTNSQTSDKKSPGKDPEKSGDVGVLPEWDLKTLMRINGVGIKSQKTLLEKEASALAFVSWVLYAYTPAGSKIIDPIGNAIVRVSETADLGKVGICKRLAKLQPFRLKQALEQSLRGFPVDVPGFDTALGCIPRERKQELLEQLFGDTA